MVISAVHWRASNWRAIIFFRGVVYASNSRRAQLSREQLSVHQHNVSALCLNIFQLLKIFMSTMLLILCVISGWCNLGVAKMQRQLIQGAHSRLLLNNKSICPNPTIADASCDYNTPFAQSSDHQANIEQTLNT